MTQSLVWFRRDLRVGDLPTLSAAGERALGLFVLDDRCSARRRSATGLPVPQLVRARRAVGRTTAGGASDPVEVVPLVAKAIGAQEVHVSADYGPYGRERDAAVAERVDLVTTGSPYAVAPGR